MGCKPSHAVDLLTSLDDRSKNLVNTAVQNTIVGFINARQCAKHLIFYVEDNFFLNRIKFSKPNLFFVIFGKVYNKGTSFFLSVYVQIKQTSFAAPHVAATENLPQLIQQLLPKMGS